MEKNPAEYLELIGKNLGQYKILDLIKETRKSWVFRAEDIGLERNVALKVLKPGQGKERGEQFLKEGPRLATLDRHKNITSVHFAGVDKNIYYIAMQLIEGDDLDKKIKSGKKFSLKEIVSIISDITDAVEYCHAKGIEHNDIKAGNIKEGQDGAYLLDFGSRLTRDKSLDDTLGIGNIAKKLLDNKDEKIKKIPKNLERIVENAANNYYKDISELKDSINKYKKNITRRKFLKVSAIATALAGLSYFGGRYQDYRNSIEFTVDKINKTNIPDLHKIKKLFGELVFKISEKTKRLITAKKIPSGRFPYDISKGGTEWTNTDDSYWTSGFWSGLLWELFNKTKDNELKDYAKTWTNAINFNEKDNATINPVRFYFSHAIGYEKTKDEKFKEIALKASEKLIKFDRKSRQFIFGEKGANYSISQIDSIETAIPFLCWRFGEIDDKSLMEKIIEHCRTTAEFNMNSDSSIVQMVAFDAESRQRLGGIKSSGYNEESCLSRAQARAIRGFATAYSTTKEQEFLDAAQKIAEYYLENLSEDFVPFYDFKDPNKNIPKDSSAAAIAVSGLIDLHKITKDKKYNDSALRILMSLCVNYLSQDKNYQGLLLHGCANKNRGVGVDVSLIYGDYYFVRSLCEASQ